MKEYSTDLPPDVLSPLKGGGLSLLLFIGLFAGWAVLAPLATTLRLSGTLVSDNPSFAVQHPYGGQIAEVFVERHTRVTAGDILLRLDTSLEHEKRDSLQQSRARIEQENAVIKSLLEGGPVSAAIEGAHLVLRFDQARKQSDMKREAAKSAALQAGALRAKIAHQTLQLEKMQGRAARFQTLIENELLAQSSGEMLDEQIQLVSSEIASQQARLISLEDQKAQAEGQADLVLLSVRQELTSTLERNLRQLEDLTPEIAHLEDVLQRANVIAPIDGIVTELNFEVSGMYAQRGLTLLSLAQPLDLPVVTFNIPTRQIDQMRAGMKGRLVLPALSQRDMPDVAVTVTAISPRAELDENARPLYFKGQADIAAEGLLALQQTVGDGFAISADMPIELMIEGRLTTFAQYIVGPLVSAFQGGLQD